MKVAIVHEWFSSYAGSEKVVEQFLNCYPDADLFAVCDFLTPEERGFLKNKPVTTTFIQRLPKAAKKFQSYLPLMPLAIEQLDMSAYDVVISSSHAVSKGVITGPDQIHISYVHSPIRYAWDFQHQYLREAGLSKGLKGWVAKYLLHKIRIWDYRTAAGVNHFIGNSQFIARRINKVYGRKADVIYPPVNTDKFEYNDQKEDFYLAACRMVPYKRVDLIVSAFAKMPDKKLVVIGDGSEMEKIKKLATPNVTLLGYQDDASLVDYMKRAKAYVFAAEEDFGISPVEAQASGTPVITYGKGGCLETVKPLGSEKPTGVFFFEQTADAICEAVNAFETYSNVINPADCREHALTFSEQRFRTEIQNFVETAWHDFSDGLINTQAKNTQNMYVNSGK
ncbi:glycosyltransferase family 4 protein [Mangrovibacter sp. MFB070]|uniref:glycosyltransferase family 4 protein n=1 Tax=Mangrovibacter sp. MFB070 TaxID=1224318 RepID=UPI000AAB9FA5|nr:glycosyltransferase family 4 protein [Mangrovibacter sp. MFB070]